MTVKETHCVICPVHIFSFQTGDVALTRAQMPAQLVKCFPFGIPLGGDNLLVFGQRDGAFFFEAHLRPLFLGQDGPRQPVHVQGEVV